jgi:hypothetical protein
VVDDFGKSLLNIETFWDRVRGAVKPALDAAMDFFVVGSEFLPEIGQEITDVSVKFRDIVRDARESGALENWIRDGIDAVKNLGKSVFNVGRSFVAVFRASKDAGADLFEMLERITDNLADFLESAEGQSTLQKLFKAASDAGRVLLPILKSTVNAVGDIVPILVRIAEKLGPGVVAVIDGLATAFKTAEPALVKAADAVGDFLKAIGDSGPLVGKVVDGVLTVLTPALEALTKLIELVVKGFNALPEPAQDVIGLIGGLGLVITAFLIIGVKFVGWLADVVKGAKDAIKFVGELGDKIKKTSSTGGGLDADGKKKPGSGPAFEMDADASRKSGEKAGDAAADGAKKGFDKGWKSKFGSVARGLGIIGIVVAVDEATGGGIAGVLDDLAGLEDASTRAQDSTDSLMGKINRLLEVPPAKEGDQGDLRNLPETMRTKFDELNEATTEKTASNAVTITGWWTGLGETFTNGWATLTGLWDSGWRGITDLAWFNQDSMSTSTTLWLAEMGATLDEKTQGFQTTLGLAWDWITGQNDVTWSDVADSVLRHMSDAGLWLDEHTGGMISSLGDLGIYLGGEWNTFWDNAADKVEEWGRDVKNAATDAVDWVGKQIDKLNNLNAQNYESGPMGGIARWIAGFNKGGKVPGGGPDKDNQVIAVTGGEWVVDRENTKKWEPLLEAITYGGADPAEPFTPDDPLSRVARGGDDGGFGGFAPVRAPRVRVAAKDGATVGDVHVTQIVNNPLPEKASVTASKRMGRLARHGLVHAVGSVSA